MNIICTQENLKAGILTTGRIISPSSSLPILSNLLLKTENGLLKISSTNLEIGVVTRVRCKIEEEGEIAVSSKTLTELVNNLPNQNISLVTEKGEMKIFGGGVNAVVKTIGAEEFPIIPEVENGGSFQIEAEDLKLALEQVLFAASTNQTQAEISGVLFAVEKQQLRVVATDRYRLAEKTLGLKSQNCPDSQFIIPHRTLSEVYRIASGFKKPIEVVFNETQGVFKIQDTEIITRLVDGQYPDYKQLIPTEFNAEVLVSREKLLGAIKVAGIFSQNGNSVKLSFGSSLGGLRVATESQDLGKSDVLVEAEVSGGGGELILNHRYISDCLNNLSEERVVIKITSDSAPSLIVPEKNRDYVYLVMPIKS